MEHPAKCSWRLFERMPPDLGRQRRGSLYAPELLNREGRTNMPIRHFVDKLIFGLKQEPIPPVVRSEKDLELEFVFPVAVRFAKAEGDVWLFSRPWGNKEKCKPDCAAAKTNNGQRVLGCPRCWRESKKWASTAAFGTRHTFDLVARGRRGTTLAITIKSVKERNGRLQNGQIQRFLGECALGASKHDVVIGICGVWRGPNSKWTLDSPRFTRWAERHDIHLVFRELRM